MTNGRITKEEALMIPDLQIEVDEMTEDLFYWAMAKAKRISKEHAEKSIERIRRCSENVPLVALNKARKMVENIDKYGVPCADWA